MLNRASQQWPEGTAIDLSTLKEITRHGLQPISDSEILQMAIRKAVNELTTPVLPSELNGMSPIESMAYRAGCYQGRMSTALMYLLDALNRVPLETEQVIAEMEYSSNSWEGLK